MMENNELMKLAAEVIKPRKVKGNFSGDVGAALVSESGKVFTGVCVDTEMSQGFCAEQSAIGQMINDGEYVFQKIVAVWKDEKGDVYVIPPCGNCRQFMKDADERNLEAEVVLDAGESVKVKELLPFHDSWKRQGWIM